MTPGIFKIGGDYSDIASSYAKNVEARRKAASEAFDRYFNEQLKAIDPNAVRPQDRAAFDALYKEWKDVGIANKKAILSNPAAKRAHEDMFANLSRFVQDSKARTEGRKPLLSILDDKQNQYRINFPKAFAAMDAHDRPLKIQDASGKWIDNTPIFDDKGNLVSGSMAIDFKQNFWNPTPVDKTKFFNSVTLGRQPVKVIGDPIPNDPKVNPRAQSLLSRFEILQPEITEYPRETIIQMGKDAEALVLRSPEYEDGFNAELQTLSKKQYDELLATLQNYFPGEDIKTAAQLAKAQTIKYAVDQRKQENAVVPDKNRLEKRRLSERAQDRAERRRSGGDEGPSVNVYDVIYDDAGIPANYTGTYNLPRSKVPAKLRLAMGGIGYKPGFGGVDLEVQNGKIISAAPSGFSSFGNPTAPITRDEILIGQQKAGAKINWGKKKSGSELN